MQGPAETLAFLKASFPRDRIEDATLRAYLSQLRDVPDDLLWLVAQEIVRTSEWFPRIADIRRVCAERMLELPSEGEALAQLEQRQDWGRTQEGTLPLVHPLVKESLDRVGGWAAYRTTAEPAVLRGQFLRLYREGRSQRLSAAQVGVLDDEMPAELRNGGIGVELTSDHIAGALG